MTTYNRRKGVAFVRSKNGILLVAGSDGVFTLPGGGADEGESRRDATRRELQEETGLVSIREEYLTSYRGEEFPTRRGAVRNYAKVFSVEAEGIAEPKNEIKYIAYWMPGRELNISIGTRLILNRIIEMETEQ